jgi:hypothetical protein
MILEEKEVEALLAVASSDDKVLGGCSYWSPRALTLASGLGTVLEFSDALD